MHNNKFVADSEKKKNTNHALLQQDERRCEYNGPNGEKLFLKKMIRRWWTVFRHNMLNIATLTAFAIFKALQPNYMSEVTHARGLFIKELTKHLVMPLTRKRHATSLLQKPSKRHDEVRLDLS